MSTYEECFADEETDNSSTVDENNNFFEQGNLNINENDCVFDKTWAWERKCSMSSLLHSRLLWRLKWITTKSSKSFIQGRDTSSPNSLKRGQRKANPKAY